MLPKYEQLLDWANLLHCPSPIGYVDEGLARVRFSYDPESPRLRQLTTMWYSDNLTIRKVVDLSDHKLSVARRYHMGKQKSSKCYFHASIRL